MLNSVLMLGSCYNKNKKVSMLFMFLMLINLLFVQSNMVSLNFLIANLLIMGIVSIFAQKIKNRKINNVVSILSIGIWSILIDTASYFMFPVYAGSSLFHYILMGLIFNSKYILMNTSIIFLVEVISYSINKVLQLKHSSQCLLINND